MSGTKGRSGRKSYREEIDIKDLYKLSVKTVREFLEKKDISKEKKVKIAIELVKKAMPQKIDLGGQEDNPLNIRVNFDKMSIGEIGKYILAKLKE